MARLDIGELIARITIDRSRADRDLREIRSGVGGLSSDFKALGKVIGTALSVESARRITMFADNFRVMNQRITTLSANTKEAAKNQKFLNDLIQETGASINDTVSVFQRFKLVEENIGLTNDQTLELIATLQRLGVVGGSTQEEMKNGLTQLAQGFASGIIRGEEFNSVMENLPLVAKTAAKGIEGVNGDMGKLRELMLDGKLDARTFADALLRAADDADQAFQKVPKSIGTNLSRAINAIGESLNALDEKYGVTERIAKGFEDIAKTISLMNDEGVAHFEWLHEEQELTIKEIEDLMKQYKELQQELEETGVPTEALLDQMGMLGDAIASDVEYAQELGAEMATVAAEAGHAEGAAKNVVSLLEHLDLPPEIMEKIVKPLQDAKEILDEAISSGGESGAPTSAKSGGDKYSPDLSEIDAYQAQVDAEIEAMTAADAEKQKIQNRAYENRLLGLKASLGDELAEIQLHYDQRIAAIEELEKQSGEELTALREEAWEAASEAVNQYYEGDEEKHKEHLARKLQQQSDYYAAISSITDSTYSIINTIGEGYRKKELKNEINAIRKRTDISEKEKDKLIEIAKKKAEEESIIEKAAFFAKQLAAIASIIVDTQKNVAAAGGYLTPTGIAAGIAGAAQVTTVAATTIGGGRIMGGDVFEGQAHRVGETAPEMIIDKAGRQFLIPSENGSKVKPLQQGGGMGSGANVNIINNTGVKANAVARVDYDGEIEVILERAQDVMENRIVEDLYEGEGAIPTAIKRLIREA